MQFNHEFILFPQRRYHALVHQHTSKSLTKRLWSTIYSWHLLNTPNLTGDPSLSIGDEKLASTMLITTSFNRAALSVMRRPLLFLWSQFCTDIIWSKWSIYQSTSNFNYLILILFWEARFHLLYFLTIYIQFRRKITHILNKLIPTYSFAQILTISGDAR